MELWGDKYPEIGDKFFAIFSDGSGGGLFMRLDNNEKDEKVFMDAEGDDDYTEESMDKYLYWQKIPDYVRFWWEDKK